MKNLISGGKAWGIREEALKRSIPQCACGRGIATESMWDGTCIMEKAGTMLGCKACAAEQYNILNDEG